MYGVVWSTRAVIGNCQWYEGLPKEMGEGDVKDMLGRRSLLCSTISSILELCRQVSALPHSPSLSSQKHNPANVWLKQERENQRSG
jgi:hypothetical protein